jgi:hypothetical protein
MIITGFSEHINRSAELTPKPISKSANQTLCSWCLGGEKKPGLLGFWGFARIDLT